MNTYTYWEQAPGEKRPAYIGHCLDIISSKCNHIHLHPGNIDEHVASLHPSWKSIKQIAHKADYLRSAVLQENGGLWLDSDTIMVSPPNVVEEYLRSGSDFVCSTNIFGQPSIGYIASKKNGEVVTNWKNEIDKELDRGKTSFSWTEIGSALVSKFISGVTWSKIETRRVLPIPYTEWKLLVSSLDWKQPEDVLAIALYNSLLPKQIKECDDILYKNILLSKLLRNNL